MCHPTDVQNLPSIIIGRMEKQPTREKVIENKNLIQSSSGPAVVLVIYEDPVIGQALTLLLDGASYWVRSIDQSSLHGSFEKLVLPTFAAGRVRLIIFAFDMSMECSEKTLEFLERKPCTADVPIMALGSSACDSQLKAVYFVPWPIRTKELKHRIETILTLTESPRSNDQ